MARLRAIVLVLRKDGVFHLDRARVVRSYDGWSRFPVAKVKAVYPRNGWGVALILQHSQVDLDFRTPTLFLTQEQLETIQEAMRQSDQLTHKLLGRGWLHGARPYFKLHELM